MRRASPFVLIPLAITLVLLQHSEPSGARAVTVGLVTDASPPPPVRHGLTKLKLALERRGASIRESSELQATADVVIVAGAPSGGGPAARLIASAGVDAPRGAESLLVRAVKEDRRRQLLVTGADPRGLMYALLDVADRVGWATDPRDPFSEVRDISEKPAVAERAVSVYTMHRAWFESRLFDEAHWARYLDMLARNRFNTFALLFAYENAGYFAPAYPYFFDVDGFPGVRVVGLTAADQERHRAALQRLIRMCHDRGLNVTVGLWDHIYRGGVQAGGMKVEPGQHVPGIVVGLDERNLTAFSRAALTKWVKTFPEIDALQFRMHGESGLKREEMHGFWKDLFEVMKTHAPRMRFEARVKDLPDSIIDMALEMGVNVRLNTKYWAEQMGLPFHPTHINRQNQHDRRHGYADLLRYPRRYDMQWQLWTGGTARILLWGDPEYVRRFAASTHLYGRAGFEVNEMLATKMASQPHDMKPFELLNPKYRYYDYEFERYWHFFQVFGRVGYNPAAPGEIWDREFERRFGTAGPHVARALHRASQILPRITAYSFPYNRFPTTRGWPEKQRREDLAEYARADGSDTQQFLSPREAARLILEGGESAMVWPHASSRWFGQSADDVLREVAQAESRVGATRSNEFLSTMVDLRILANLARYHSRRALAGVSWSLWDLSRDLNALDDAIAQEGRAIEAWEEIVKAAGDVYADSLRMGLASAGLTGHWRDELSALRTGLHKMKELRESFKPETPAWPTVAHVPVRRVRPGQDAVLRATIASRDRIHSARVVVRNGRGSSQVPLDSIGPFRYRAVISKDLLRDGATYVIEAVDEDGRRARYPLQPEQRVALTVASDDEPPAVRHIAVDRAPAGKPITIAAEVTDPSGVKWVRLRYRPVNQQYDYDALEMTPTGHPNEYRAVVPAGEIDPKWDFMYLIETMDRQGNGGIHPDLEKGQPYIVVRLARGGAVSSSK